MHLIGGGHIELRAWDPPWCRQVYLPDGLFLQPVLSHIFRNLGCRRQLLDGCESLPFWGYNRALTTLLSGESPLTHGVRVAKYSKSLISLQHADATGSGSSPVVSWRFVMPANTLRANITMVLSSSRQSSSSSSSAQYRPVWAIGPGIL